jgi:Lon protease-like protein
MFPLGTVLLPGGLLPLHVFEPRYRRLVEDALEGEAHEFGVVLIERGSEVGGGDQRTGVGTVARMLQVAQMADGRYALVVVGTQRVRVVAWLPDDPYPLADVEVWLDEGPDAPGLQARVDEVASRLRSALALAVELGDSVADAELHLGDDPLLATYHLSGMAPLGPADRQRLLAAPGPDARLTLLTELLDGVEEVLAFRLATSEQPDEPFGDVGP